MIAQGPGPFDWWDDEGPTGEPCWRLRCMECDADGLADDKETARALAGQHVSETGHHVMAEEITDASELERESERGLSHRGR